MTPSQFIKHVLLNAVLFASGIVMVLSTRNGTAFAVSAVVFGLACMGLFLFSLKLRQKKS